MSQAASLETPTYIDNTIDRKNRLNRLSTPKTPCQLSVRLTGDMAEIWSDLTRTKAKEISHSQLLKEAIKLRYLIALQKEAGSDLYTDIELNGKLVAISEFLNIS